MKCQSAGAHKYMKYLFLDPACNFKHLQKSNIRPTSCKGPEDLCIWRQHTVVKFASETSAAPASLCTSDVWDMLTNSEVHEFSLKSTQSFSGYCGILSKVKFTFSLQKNWAHKC